MTVVVVAMTNEEDNSKKGDIGGVLVAMVVVMAIDIGGDDNRCGGYGVMIWLAMAMR